MDFLSGWQSGLGWSGNFRTRVSIRWSDWKRSRCEIGEEIFHRRRDVHGDFRSRNRDAGGIRQGTDFREGRWRRWGVRRRFLHRRRGWWWLQNDRFHFTNGQVRRERLRCKQARHSENRQYDGGGGNADDGGAEVQSSIFKFQERGWGCGKRVKPER